MTQEQDLLVRWRSLPSQQQQTVLDFIEFLQTKGLPVPVIDHSVEESLGNRLRSLRTKIVASGEPLLNQTDLEQELVSRRGGVEPD
ncbi:hypothetical protein IQ254_26950 [Nodosilinea sp. LEGE 07088]|uniref:hypothetical protein n=1 Tax=Nodosilinea sp. LEGE 07088 TaxID=2777968 RepID=UPI0018800C26|nr:hypothetical protein [Nodosilinea sp. LEGE 07088]MBE9140794.1 hypothetical protein [Nodosilinea sp. LEGE 07088]